LQRAREQGFVAPRVYGEIDPSLLTSTSAAPLLAFARTHSDEQRGMRQWITKYKGQITDLTSTIRFLQENQMTAAMNPAEIEGYATSQADLFKRRGWWRGPTPAEIQETEEEARKKVGKPFGGQPASKIQSRESVIADEMRQRTPRRPGFEMAPAEKQEERKQQAAPLQLSDEARAFYGSDRSSGLGAAIEGRLHRMYMDKKDGKLMEQAFGQATTDEQGQMVLPEKALADIQAEIYRFLTSTSQVEATLRNSWGIKVSGQGAQMRADVPNLKLTGEALQNYVMDMAGRRKRAAQ
jgi:hypothetical protein